MDLDALFSYRYYRWMWLTIWTLAYPPKPAERVVLNAWPPPQGPRPFWPNVPAYGLHWPGLHIHGGAT